MKRIDLHPVLFALFPVLSLFVNNRGKISADQTLGSIVAVAILTALFWGLALFWLKDGAKSAILTSVSLILFFSFGHARDLFLIALALFGHVDVANVFAQSKPGQMMAGLVWLGLWGFVGYLIKRIRLDVRPVSQFLNVSALVLLATVSFTWVTWRIQEANAYNFIDAWNRSLRSVESVSPDTRSNRPNIFYIILDEYARQDVLAETYHLDNSAFSAYLTARGFCVAQQSASNYSQTELSLASSLNSIYLDDMASKIGRQSTNRLPLEAMIQNNRLFRRLHDDGYTTMSFASGYSYSEIKTADVFKSPATGLSDFESELLETTPLPILFELPFLKDGYDLQRERILYTLDHLADANQLPSPVLVFAHIPAPHSPFLFGAQGEPLRPHRVISVAQGVEFTDNITPQEYVEAYRNQMIFITQRVERAVDAILASSRGPSVIILQADHGPSSKQMSPNDPKEIYAERMSTFTALYLPDGDSRQLCPSVTPVNLFRILSNHYLGAQFEILGDKSYFSPYDSPYAFIDVTDVVRPLDRAGSK